MMVKSGGKNRADIVAGDILCAKSDGSRYVFDAEDASDISLTDWTPIGVVVIPPSHDVYGTGEGAAVSLRYMSRSTPDEGSRLYQDICWGQNGVNTSVADFTAVNTTNNTANPTISYTDRAYLPSDNFTNTQCITDPITYYQISPYVPSPYLSDGSRNEDYYTTEYTTYNVLSDFDGIGNTNILCSLATAQSDWRTASTITDSDSSGYSPAACCCWRYHTIGTNQGDWYLPTIGELGYLIVRLKTIINSINNVEDETTIINAGFLSSSEYFFNSCYIMFTSNGIINYSNKYTRFYVRSFIHF